MILLGLSALGDLLERGQEEIEPEGPAVDVWQRPVDGFDWLAAKAAGYSDSELETAWQGLMDQQATPSSDPSS